MIRIRLAATVAAVAVGGVLLTACGEKEENLGAGATTTTTATSQATVEIAGDWTGQLTQKGLAPFHVAARIEPSGSAEVAYTGIDCGGTWSASAAPVASTGPTFTFEETIDEGAGGTCKGTGTVVVTHQANDTLNYRFTGGHQPRGAAANRRGGTAPDLPAGGRHSAGLSKPASPAAPRVSAIIWRVTRAIRE
jgi:hypothetical protein